MWDGHKPSLPSRLDVANPPTCGPLLILSPALMVTQVYDLGNFHWVLRLLLIAPSRQYLCLKFDPLCDRPHIAKANREELAVVDLIAN